jgi:hypothetical protein
MTERSENLIIVTLSKTDDPNEMRNRFDTRLAAALPSAKSTKYLPRLGMVFVDLGANANIEVDMEIVRKFESVLDVMKNGIVEQIKPVNMKVIP